MCRTPLTATVLLLPILISTGHARAAEPALEILNAAVSQTEDGPAAARDYRFAPGDILYFSFQVARFAIHRNEEADTSQIDLSYEISLEDSKGNLVLQKVSDRIAAQLNSEDKNWLPKRRASFQIPDLLAAGEYRVHVVVQDAFAHTQCETAVRILVGGEDITPSGTLTIERFRFVRDENDPAPLSVAAYRPGDSVFTKFDIAGFVISAKDNGYDVQYGLTVLGPDGKLFVQADTAETLQGSTFYPAQYLPATLEVLTKPTSSRGVYTLILEVRDLDGNRSYEMKQVFTLE